MAKETVSSAVTVDKTCPLMQQLSHRTIFKSNCGVHFKFKKRIGFALGSLNK